MSLLDRVMRIDLAVRWRRCQCGTMKRRVEGAVRLRPQNGDIAAAEAMIDAIVLTVPASGRMSFSSYRVKCQRGEQVFGRWCRGVP